MRNAECGIRNHNHTIIELRYFVTSRLTNLPSQGDNSGTVGPMQVACLRILRDLRQTRYEKTWHGSSLSLRMKASEQAVSRKRVKEHGLSSPAPPSGPTDCGACRSGQAEERRLKSFHAHIMLFISYLIEHVDSRSAVVHAVSSTITPDLTVWIRPRKRKAPGCKDPPLDAMRGVS